MISILTLISGFKLIDASVLSHDALTRPDDHLLWQTVTENHADVYEPEYLVEMYVSLEYSICAIYYLCIGIKKATARPSKSDAQFQNGYI